VAEIVPALASVLDVGLTQPVAQTGFGDAEVGGDLLDRLAAS
jgi:hypothetical protein